MNCHAEHQTCGRPAVGSLRAVFDNDFLFRATPFCDEHLNTKEAELRAEPLYTEIERRPLP